MLLASAIVGTCAVPVQSAAFSKTHIRRSHNTWKNNFFRPDPGRDKNLSMFPSRSWLSTSKLSATLSQCGLQTGHALDLGTVLLRLDGAITIRVVGIWAKGQREPWWLATNRDDSLSILAAYYDRHMRIEEQIHDTKGARFGFTLVSTQITTPEALVPLSSSPWPSCSLPQLATQLLSVAQTCASLLKRKATASLSPYCRLPLLPSLHRTSNLPCKVSLSYHPSSHTSLLRVLRNYLNREDVKVIDGQFFSPLCS